MMYTMLLCLVIHMGLFAVGVESQSLIIYEPERQPGPMCAFDLVADKEYFTMEGQADPSTASDPNDWNSLVIDVEVRGPQGTVFALLGSLDVTNNCIGYQPPPPSTPNTTIYCDKETDGVYHFVVNSTANIVYSRAEIRAKWNSNSLNSITSKTRTLPPISDAEEPQATISCDNTTADLLAEKTFSFSSTDCTNIEFYVRDSVNSSFSTHMSIKDIQIKTSEQQRISNRKWCVSGISILEVGFDRSSGCVRSRTYSGDMRPDSLFQWKVLIITDIVSVVCGLIIILLCWKYESWIVYFPCCGGKKKDITREHDNRAAVEMANKPINGQ